MLRSQYGVAMNHLVELVIAATGVIVLVAAPWLGPRSGEAGVDARYAELRRLIGVALLGIALVYFLARLASRT